MLEEPHGRHVYGEGLKTGQALCFFSVVLLCNLIQTGPWPLQLLCEVRSGWEWRAGSLWLSGGQRSSTNSAGTGECVAVRLH